MYFFSYSSRNQQEATHLVAGLKEQQIPLWCDLHENAVPAGKPFIEVLEEQLEVAKAYLVLVDQNPIVRWVRAELDYALKRQALASDFRVIPLLLNGARPEELPPLLSRFKAISLEGDVRKWRSLEFANLAGQLRDESVPRRQREPPLQISCPFPGLEHFDEEFSEFYFGREKQIFEALKLLGHSQDGHRRWLHITGAIGTGKSSFVRAGLIPAIQRGWLRGTIREWHIVRLRPSSQLLLRLATVLTQSIPEEPDIQRLFYEPENGGLSAIAAKAGLANRGLLLVVDQMEELQLGRVDEQERLRLAEMISSALRNARNFYLITCLRSDFKGSGVWESLGTMGDLKPTFCSEYPLAPMSMDGIEQAILGPSALARVSVEPRLIAQLRHDITAQDGESTGRLLLLANVLQMLWESRGVGQILSFKAYEDIGGITGALTMRAQNVLRALSEEEKEPAFKMLLSLVRLVDGADGKKVVRHARFRDELIEVAGGGLLGEKIFLALTNGRAFYDGGGGSTQARLVVDRPDGRLELVHDALLSEWDELERRIGDERQLLDVRERLETVARAWDRSHQDKRYLQRLSKDELVEFKKANSPSRVSKLFLQAASSAYQRRFRMGVLWVLLAVLGVLTIPIWLQNFRLQNSNVAQLERNLDAQKAEINRLTAEKKTLYEQTGELGDRLNACTQECVETLKAMAVRVRDDMKNAGDSAKAAAGHLRKVEGLSEEVELAAQNATDAAIMAQADMRQAELAVRNAELAAQDAGWSATAALQHSQSAESFAHAADLASRDAGGFAFAAWQYAHQADDAAQNVDLAARDTRTAALAAWQYAQQLDRFFQDGGPAARLEDVAILPQDGGPTARLEDVAILPQDGGPTARLEDVAIPTEEPADGGGADAGGRKEQASAHGD